MWCYCVHYKIALFSTTFINIHKIIIVQFETYYLRKVQYWTPKKFQNGKTRNIWKSQKLKHTKRMENYCRIEIEMIVDGINYDVWRFVLRVIKGLSEVKKTFLGWIDVKAVVINNYYLVCCVKTCADFVYVVIITIKTSYKWEVS